MHLTWQPSLVAVESPRNLQILTIVVKGHSNPYDATKKQVLHRKTGKWCLDKVNNLIKTFTILYFVSPYVLIVMYIKKFGLIQVGWFLGYCLLDTS